MEIDSGDNRFKRVGQSPGKEQGKKKVHLDPFAMIQQVYREQGKAEIVEVEAKDNRPLLKHQIQCVTCQTQEFVHQKYFPVNQQKDVNIKNINNSFVEYGASSIVRKCLDGLLQKQSLILHQKQNQISNFLSMATKQFKTSQQKFIYISNSQLCTSRYRSFRSQIRHSKLMMAEEELRYDYQCLVVTAQKLRNITFYQFNLLNHYQWAIFEIRSPEGNILQTVQELAITLPLNINYIFLLHQQKANSSQFVTWLSSLRVRPFHLIYPKTLTKYPSLFIYPSKGEGFYKIKNQQGQFIEQNYRKMNDNFTNKDQKARKSQLFSNKLQQTVKTLYSLQLSPVLFVSSRKKQIQHHARLIFQSFDFTSRQQKNKIEVLFSNTLMMLDNGQQTEQILIFKEYIIRGIGIFHQGLFPVLRELVILLSQEGLLTVIFSTEVKVTLKTKCIFLTEVRKESIRGSSINANLNFRNIYLNSAAQNELIVMYLTQKIQRQHLKEITNLERSELISSFKLDLYSVLNYQSFEDMDASYVLERTFAQFQNYNLFSVLEKQCEELQSEFNSVLFQDQGQIQIIKELNYKQRELNTKWKQLMFTPSRIIPYLCVGRIVKLKDGLKDWGLGIVVNIHRIQNEKKFKVQGVKCFMDILVYVKVEMKDHICCPLPIELNSCSQLDQQKQFTVLTFDLEAISDILNIKLSVLPNNLHNESNLLILFETLKGIVAMNPKSIEIQCTTRQALDLKEELKQLKKQLSSLEYLNSYFQQFKNNELIKEQLNQKRAKLKVKGQIIYKKPLKGYLKMIKLHGLFQKGEITQKGKAASMINSPYSVIIVQLMQQGFYQNLSSAQIAALSVCLVDCLRAPTSRHKTKHMQIRNKISQLIQSSKRMCKDYKEFKLQLTEDDLIDGIKEHYIEGTIRWCQGQQLSLICSSLQIFQGMFVSILKKLSVLLSQMCLSAHILNLKNQEKAFRDVLNIVKRKQFDFGCS